MAKAKKSAKKTTKGKIKKKTTKRRTTLRSSKGKKLYGVRDSAGKFEDIQTYERAHGQDIQRQAKDEA